MDLLNICINDDRGAVCASYMDATQWIYSLTAKLYRLQSVSIALHLLVELVELVEHDVCPS